MKLLVAFALYLSAIMVTAHDLKLAELKSQSTPYYQQVTRQLNEQWPLELAIDWQLDYQLGEITWELADQRILKAQVQIIGTYNAQNKGFIWGWDHPSVSWKMHQEASFIREFGQRHHIRALTKAQLTVNEQELQDLLEIAVWLGKAEGGYIAEVADTQVLLTLRDVRW